jgi:DME family drug/metabolite transporter
LFGDADTQTVLASSKSARLRQMLSRWTESITKHDDAQQYSNAMQPVLKHDLRERHFHSSHVIPSTFRGSLRFRTGINPTSREAPQPMVWSGPADYTVTVQAPISSPPKKRLTLSQSLHDPLVFGTLCGLASALGYTAANVCLRAVSDCDAVWVSCVKAFPTVAMFGPVLLYRLGRGTETLPPARQMTALVIASLICQLLGNVVFQWSLGIVGMALAVPLTLGTMIVAGAVMGRVVLNESVTMRMALSTVVLIGAISILSLGAGEASRTVAIANQAPSAWLVSAGVGAACLSGIAYALLGVVIRYAVTDRISIPLTLVCVTLTGVIALGAVAVLRIGISGMLATVPEDFWTMMLAGFFNAVAFLALTKSLQLIPIVYVNAVSATQAAMAALAGILMFSERSSSALWFGVIMTVVGLLMMQRKSTRESLVNEMKDDGDRTKCR